MSKVYMNIYENTVVYCIIVTIFEAYSRKYVENKCKSTEFFIGRT